MISAGIAHSIFVDSGGITYSCGSNYNGKFFLFSFFFYFLFSLSYLK